ncbi:metalloregulator ArsR/SmtB family transcription factor [uncultured Brevundimonas sp.]|uniref:ArsR/SmtB family transcription factor n=1 Tax=uncultured Brevundimonas sp. TaxID=213418 RepID=UPI0030EF6F6C|tara:strand:+ start:205 stop:540 length:336 start_codon:yes stop_codon:yes gene_type:complete
MLDLDTHRLERLEASAGSAARLLKAMANEKRLMILCQLDGRELQVGEMLARVSLSQSALSQHLGLLREEGLVSTRREGVAVFYRLANPAVAEVIATLAEIYCPPETEERNS